MQEKGTLGTFQVQEGFLVTLLALRCRCPWERTGVSFLGAKGSPQLIANKEGEPQYYNHKELGSANNLQELGNGISPP